ncbi:hypothetical protein EV198_3491 [Roseivirga ehrenbergii]|uniref:Anti-sigma factor n=1 Tax=Roseivirga ehrenbergii (strain DSM 102268 / JCM 13514 / KCTC 12282 / NCIMB 14502 / KMM 6017) TaxID=279360 RepID=A0A150WXT5_ROSEK|nr:hypothetical protein [Roseivirga ehrenbergii]KYG71300.1 hypothetical protein MB14_11005 [Roseivirga ehrenbergii]TCK99660.1 hypothetical protein EV198_3491 [Roseivirga ehrenbergii]
MRDKLEDFIKDNKEHFDTEAPRAEVWNKIQKGLDTNDKTTGTSTHWFWKVAVAVLLIAVAYLGSEKYFGSEMREESTAMEEFKELETFYTQMISDKKMMLSEEVETGGHFSFLEADIQSLDQNYEELKSAFENGQETPQLKSALVHLLKQKLYLLEKQLEVLEESKSETSEDVSSL